MRLDRRELLFLATTLGAGLRSELSSAAAALEEHDLEFPGEALARRCLVVAPSGAAARRGLLVVFHGLGETKSEALGVRAFVDRYGLRSAYERLCAPPVARTLKDAKFLTDERLGTLNEELSREPFGGFVVVCPFTPNVYRQPSTAKALDRYAAWIVERVLPGVRSRFGVPELADATAVDGVSLGGYVSLEVFLRRPEAFGAAGTTQGAFGVPLADAYATRIAEVLARVGPRELRVGSSGGDGGRKAHERLVKQLEARGHRVSFSVPPGPHDQRWLREIGTLELLLHYDRVFGRRSARQGGS